MPKSRKKSSKPTLAEKADRHRLYELSVQCPEAEIDFVDKTYKMLRGRKAHLLREDFCGTASVCCEWVKRRKTNRAIGVDLDPHVLAWGMEHRVGALPEQQEKRITLIESDVVKAKTEAPDIISAMNFSYWLLRERSVLKRYLRNTYRALKDDGVLFLDCYGGYDSHREIEEDREIDDGGKDFTYIWDQAEFDPINHRVLCHIHFAFPDGSRLDKAFSYEWRLWTLPELRDLLSECGFERVTVYWQGWDEDGEPDGEFTPVETGEADAGWICYITAEK